ncbi:hypothetical protein VF14_27490 [Nostoc linckia z18]|uniref:Uncharacterized protein n=2 Tax=Nostoc linckia TaxID=92942 RepID=A0A9Q5Z7X0_NOSLI|nr:hypothetical protein [Nostoc linckia]PHK38832.1 hypothetical protein VF12_16685 [Nostoc linckia z15]PHK43502.1 hypothetical protein VF13_26895 [Nostoc linckia z16]PHJ56245.1 hypothetical protein VF02_33730 [Nostoc linckia z1]PHJ58125.1 hypothetical protein VF05_34620 [Nostoc linckia z3]PHJ60665.1 hypothetical protein VF03_33180 [Nostoc linckia z2]
MLKTILLLSLISGLDGFTKPSLDLNQKFSQQVDNTKLPNTSKQIIAQRKAPINSPKNTSTTKETYPTLEVDGFLFQFKGCKSTEPRVTRCDLVVKNTTRERRGLSIGSRTRIIDDLGNELDASSFTLGSNQNNWPQAVNDLPANTSLKANIIFRGDIGSNIILLDIRANNSQIEFRQK